MKLTNEQLIHIFIGLIGLAIMILTLDLTLKAVGDAAINCTAEHPCDMLMVLS
jgi:hypothetical protein